MSMERTRGEDWVVTAIIELRKANSWTGRIHVQKLLFTVDVLKLGTPPFEFELYLYGPYSQEVDWAFTALEMTGSIERDYPLPGYGPKYAVLANKCSLPTPAVSAIARVARSFGTKSSKDLELIATCLWVERREQVQGEEQIIKRVKQIKPKYTQAEIANQLKETRALAETLI